MPEESSSSAGVSSVAAGSSSTAIGTWDDCRKRIFRFASWSVTPACGANSAAESVVGMATWRGLGAAASQVSGSAAREVAAAISAALSAMPFQTQKQATLVPSITLPPPSATIRSASCWRISAASASTSSIGECARIALVSATRRLPMAARVARAIALSARDRVVTSSTRVTSAISGGSISATEAAVAHALLRRPAMDAVGHRVSSPVSSARSMP